MSTGGRAAHVTNSSWDGEPVIAEVPRQVHRPSGQGWRHRRYSGCHIESFTTTK